MSIDPILSAIRYASLPKHEGAGFTLSITFSDGTWIEASVQKINAYPFYRLYPFEKVMRGKEPKDEPMYVNLAHVKYVQPRFG